jgi:hypothetical protein
VHQGDISSYAECAISIDLKQDHNYNRLEEKNNNKVILTVILIKITTDFIFYKSIS